MTIGGLLSSMRVCVVIDKGVDEGHDGTAISEKASLVQADEKVAEASVEGISEELENTEVHTS